MNFIIYGRYIVSPFFLQYHEVIFILKIYYMKYILVVYAYYLLILQYNREDVLPNMS